MVMVACNLCGSVKSDTVYRGLPDYLLGRREVSATFVKCAECGLVFQSPRLAPVDLSSHYPDTYELYRAQSGDASWLKVARNYGNLKRGKYVTRHVKKGRLLDVGCASGTFLQVMKRQGGWELFGIEPNATAAEAARQAGGVVITTESIEEAIFPNCHFDAVTMWDVLEHLQDPLSDLRRVRLMMKDGAIIVLRVPNLGSLDAKIFGRYWAGWEPPRHLYAFDRATVDRLLTSAGFKVMDIDARSANYTTFLVSLRFLLKAKISRHDSREGLLDLLHQPLFRLVSAPLFFAISRTPYGGQLVITAAKAGA